MTIKQTLQAIRELGLTAKWISETREFRINFKNGTEETACYTDREDAIGTARAFSAYKPVETVEEVEEVEEVTATTSSIKLPVMAVNNVSQVVCVGHVLCETDGSFQAQPFVGRPWERFASYAQADKYTRGE